MIFKIINQCNLFFLINIYIYFYRKPLFQELKKVIENMKPTNYKKILEETIKKVILLLFFFYYIEKYSGFSHFNGYSNGGHTKLKFANKSQSLPDLTNFTKKVDDNHIILNYRTKDIAR